MKKNYLLLGAMALVGLFASCSQTETEDLADNRTEIGKRVTFTATVPTEFAQPKTRAGGDDDVRHYIVEIWNSDGTTMLQRQEKIATDENADKFSFDLENGTYQVLFWADKVASDAKKIVDHTLTFNNNTVTFDHYVEKYYKTVVVSSTGAGLRDVMINSTGSDPDVFINKDVCDAFCHHEELVKDANMVDMKVTLKRPLCKIILQQKNPTKETTTDLCKEIHIGKEYSDRDQYHLIYAVDYDIYTGEVGYTYTVKNTLTLLPNAATDGNLLYFYTFAPRKGGVLEGTTAYNNITIGFNKADGSDKELEDLTIPGSSIPLKQNYNIYVKGNIIKEKTTGPTTAFTISTDANWAGDDTTTDLDNSN